jgi:hypothetical protein
VSVVVVAAVMSYAWVLWSMPWLGGWRFNLGGSITGLHLGWAGLVLLPAFWKLVTWMVVLEANRIRW